MSTLYESDIESHLIKLLGKQGWTFLEVEQREEMRDQHHRETLLRPVLTEAVNRLNPTLPDEAKQEAINELQDIERGSLSEANHTFHRMITEGIAVEYQKNGKKIGDRVKLIDFQNPSNNKYHCANQYSVQYDRRIKRPDVVCFINGIPVVLVELKNPNDEEATLQKAYQQLQTYKKTIPNLLVYNALMVISDGIDAKAGALTAPRGRFMEWKTKDGKQEASHLIPQIETLSQGMLAHNILLDLIRYFTVFEQEEVKDRQGVVSIGTIKKIAAYHQYYAVNKAIEQSTHATHEQGDRKIGVVWHTQGSGKSLSMVFYAGKIVQSLNNPTIVMITDRNDLDDQLFGTFSNCAQLLRQKPTQAENRQNLKELLNTTGGGIVFTTIQKFMPEGDNEEFERLSERKNIIVIADEAHRSQYGFGAKTTLKGKHATTRYGFAKYLRDALPHASFIGFTGTPIEKDDANTKAVFGDYIDVYDIQQAVDDGATVPIYYESRLIKLNINDDDMDRLDHTITELSDGEQSTQQQQKNKLTKLESIVGHSERLKTIAKDITDHFSQRQEIIEGKGMIVCMSRRIAVELYKEIVTLYPNRKHASLNQGAIKVVMTSASSDPLEWQDHHTTKTQRKELAQRLKDPNDELKLVIVCDMWLTGFDAPSLHTMYIDKLMKGHTLMQAIARVNRVYKDKPGGVIVDYIGIGSDLKKALAVYTESGGKGKPTFDQADAIALMQEKYEVVQGIMKDFDYSRYFSADTKEKMNIILAAQDYILGLEKENGAKRFTDTVTALDKAFALSVPSIQAMNIKNEVGFFQAIKTRLNKYTAGVNNENNQLIESTIKQMVEDSVQVEGVMDVFQMAGMEKPELSILSEDFLLEVKDMEHKNVALEVLKKLLNDEIKKRGKKNIVQGKKFSDMLKETINKYHNNLITTAQIIEELIEIAKKMKQMDDEAKESGLNDDEIAFYDALATNNSAQDVLGDKQLREIAQLLTKRIKENTTIDRQIKESAQANIRRIVKRILRQYGYPPDQQAIATELILTQAKVHADEWTKERKYK